MQTVVRQINNYINIIRNQVFSIRNKRKLKEDKSVWSLTRIGNFSINLS